MKRFMVALFAALALMLGLFTAPAQAAVPVEVQSGMKYFHNLPPSGYDGFCTLGAVGFDAAGNRVGITAGHCNQIGSIAKTEDGKRFGTVVTRKQEWTDPGFAKYDTFDYAFILLDDNAVMIDDPATRVNPLSVGTPGSWLNMCKFGHAPVFPGEKCGFSIGLRPIEFDANMSSLFGDSGGPVYKKSDPTVLYGIVSRPTVGGLTTMQRVDAASADALANGWIGGGFYPVA